MSTYNNTLSVFLFLVLSFTLTAQTYVTDGEDLQDLVNAATPGEIFIIPNGTYNDFESTFTATATAAAPIYIKAESIGGVTLTGESFFVFKKAAHIILEGFVFDATHDETLVKMEGAHHIRITRNVFELETEESIKWIVIDGFWNDYEFEFQSHHNRIDHNIFQNKDTPGHYITINGTSNENESISLQSQYDRIDHNYFKNNGPRIENGQESIRIGVSDMSLSSGFTMVEFNLFEDCDGDPEIISVKSCDNTIRHNTFRKNYGTLTLRHGNRNTVAGNYFFGGGKPDGIFTNDDGTDVTIYTGGIRIYGTDHLIINNYMEGLQGTRWDAPITLTQGDAIDGGSSNLTKHFRAERVLIAYNTFVNNKYGIEIGYDKGGDYNKGLVDITFANNLITGTENSLVDFVDGNDQGDELNWYNNLAWPTATATVNTGSVTFDESEVKVIDPELEFDNTVWKSTSSTPVFENETSTPLSGMDIEGQERPSVSNPGADHFSQGQQWYGPLFPDDVGPNAMDMITTTEEATDIVNSVKLFPIPANDILTLTNGEASVDRIQIFNLAGQSLLDSEVSIPPNQMITIPLVGYLNGQYVLLLSTDQQWIARKFIVMD